MTKANDIAVLKDVPTASLVPSPLNVDGRKADAEFVASVREHGIQTPLKVRRVAGSDTLEIVNGQRRWTAAKQLKLKVVPAVVYEHMTDLEAQELRIIENLHRKNLHPLEEAEAFGHLATLRGHKEDVTTLVLVGRTYADIAADVAKSETYVAERMALLNLTKAARESFRKGELLLTTAFRLARLPREAQDEALGEILRNGRWALQQGGAIAPRDAESVLAQYRRDLASAPFPLDNKGFGHAAGSCTTCAKRTGNRPDLFQDIQGKSVCMDQPCFQNKAAAWIKAEVERREKAGEPVLKGDAAKAVLQEQKYSETLIEKKPGEYVLLDEPRYVDGKPTTYRKLLGKEHAVPTTWALLRGDTRLVALAKTEDVHAGLVAAGHLPSPQAGKKKDDDRGMDEEVAQKEQAENKKRREALKRDHWVTTRVFRLVYERAKKGTIGAGWWSWLAERVVHRMAHNDKKLFADLLGVEGISQTYGKDYEAPLMSRVRAGSALDNRALATVGMCVCYDLESNLDLLGEVAKSFGVKLGEERRRLARQYEEERKAKTQKKAGRKETPAKKKATAS